MAVRALTVWYRPLNVVSTNQSELGEIRNSRADSAASRWAGRTVRPAMPEGSPKEIVVIRDFSKKIVVV